jgi:oligoribonuclease NrnB/cAMP/cGMP phosphodiesterase (DHH superfamily)
MKPLCIYHGNCADGFGAAWVVRRKFPEAEFHAGVYQNPPPDVTGRDVIIVDFSYKMPVMLDVIAKAASVTILDHHKTAAEDLWEIFSRGLAKGQYSDNRSGAGLTWDYFFPDEPRPALINHIEDRDLWLFKLPQTREIQAAVFSYPYDFFTWDALMEEAPLAELAIEGAAIERKHHKDIAELVGVTRRSMMIGGHVVPVANLPYTLTSDAGNLMATGEPFAACYWDTPEGRVFSLRSTDDGLDVSAIAKGYGGGGHRNASGFRMPRGWEGDAP